MSKLHNFVADELQNPELIQGARRGRGRRGRRGNPNVDNNPFDGNDSYTPRLKNPYKELDRVINKANRRNERGIAKARRQAGRRR